VKKKDAPMLQPFFGSRDTRWAETWQELGEGAPTLAGFARLCSLALAGHAQPDRPLSLEAKAILHSARERGMIEIKGSNRAFDAPARLLAVHVETSQQRSIIFRNRDKPEVTIRFLAGFRELCEAGLAMHHIYGDFSLTREGFEAAHHVSVAEIEAQLREGIEMDWE
jgi:hypothetical protein